MRNLRTFSTPNAARLVASTESIANDSDILVVSRSQPQVKLRKRTKASKRLQQMELRNNTELRVLSICQLVRTMGNRDMKHDPSEWRR
jgi:hypothetical protein